MEKKYRLLLLYLIVALVFDISGRLFGYFFKYNLFLIPLYGFAELIVFCYIFTIKRAYFLAVVTIASLLVGYEIISIDPLDTSGFNSYSKVFSNFSILLMAFLSYYRVLEQEKMIEKKILIFNSLTFIYFALSLILYIPLNFLISKDSDLPFYFWNLNLIITSSFYAYISYLIWNSGKHLKQSPLG
ncbi:MAG: hypothetical protein ACJASQ_002551 [Crocinitomicaceae bacterium]|jgi:hypothetical protein